LVKSPGFTLTAILTLGLPIGACTAIFSLVYGVTLQPLPYPRPDRLVHVWQYNQSGEYVGRAPFSDRNFEDVRGQHLDGDGPLQPGVGGLVDLPHPPSADGGLDLIRAEASAVLQGHELSVKTARL
jgi:hypothetical protein